MEGVISLTLRVVFRPQLGFFLIRVWLVHLQPRVRQILVQVTYKIGGCFPLAHRLGCFLLSLLLSRVSLISLTMTVTVSRLGFILHNCDLPLGKSHVKFTPMQAASPIFDSLEQPYYSSFQSLQAVYLEFCQNVQVKPRGGMDHRRFIPIGQKRTPMSYLLDL